MNRRGKCGNLMSVLLLTIAGCLGQSGAGLPPLPELIEVTGVVTRGGKPLQNVYVSFYPESGGAEKSSGGSTDAEGKFTLTYQHRAPGAVEGHHLVKIDVTDADGDPNLVPMRYRDEQTSGLTASVEKGIDNHFTFSLK